jgi:mono/diheme cytochrome c family protein
MTPRGGSGAGEGAAVGRDSRRNMKPFIVISAAVLAGATCGAALRPAEAAEQAAAPAQDADQVAHGKSLFISYGCGWCHEDGGRKPGKCPQLMHSPRDDDFIINRIVGGSPGKMPAFGQQLVDTDIRALLAYIRNLQPES